VTPLAFLFALVIGGSLGLVGGGGSILTVPALIHAGGLEPRSAIAASLIVVGLTATSGALWHLRLGTLDARVVLTFGGGGAIASVAGAALGKRIPGNWLLLALAVIAVVAGLRFLGAGTSEQTVRPRGPLIIVLAALVVGFLTGLLGVGGGFLIVPALVFAVGLPIARAIGTSLGVIAINCAAGLTGAASALESQHAALIATFAAIAIAGSLLGARTANRIRPEALRRGFGLLVLLVGLYTGGTALL